MKKNVGFYILVICLVIASVVFGLFYFIRQPDRNIACTLEAKLCLDGSSVGRTGPNCEFSKCPGEAVPSSMDEHRNIAYSVDGKVITLTNGASVVEDGSGLGSVTVTKYFGNEVRADLNNDGQTDVAFLLTEDTGGSGTFYYVVAALQTATGYQGTNAILLGDRIAPQSTVFENGEVVVNYTNRKPNEPMTNDPSVGVSRYFVVKNNELVEQEKQAYGDLIHVTSPKPQAEVQSPLTISGEARGTWYFEASFPVRLLDANGNVLATVPAEAKSDWMTTDFVPFEVQLSFATPTTPTGTLVLHNDNPSGLPANDKEVRVPVIFSSNSGSRTIKLYYYNGAKDQSPGGIACSANGLEVVTRMIPITKTPIQDVIRLLLRGELLSDERAKGVTTEFPLVGVELTAASLRDGVLTLSFKDPQNKTGGGSCRVNILRLQIEATAKQFPEVKSVRFAPEELFQP